MVGIAGTSGHPDTRYGEMLAEIAADPAKFKARLKELAEANKALDARQRETSVSVAASLKAAEAEAAEIVAEAKVTAKRVAAETKAKAMDAEKLANSHRADADRRMAVAVQTEKDLAARADKLAEDEARLQRLLGDAETMRDQAAMTRTRAEAKLDRMKAMWAEG